MCVESMCVKLCRGFENEREKKITKITKEKTKEKRLVLLC